ncbi:MAG: hypothetical protein ABFD49_08685 [Armatimonadota bacterium]|nr:hypothetical protein [bacterium]
MITALNENTKRLESVLADGEGRLCVQNAPKYQDLGEVFSGDSGGAGYQLAANAWAIASNVTGLQWQRHIVVQNKATSGAAATLYIRRVDSSGNTAAGSALSTITGNGTYGASASANNILGYGVQFALQNTGSSTADFWVRVQLMA